MKCRTANIYTGHFRVELFIYLFDWSVFDLRSFRTSSFVLAACPRTHFEKPLSRPRRMSGDMQQNGPCGFSFGSKSAEPPAQSGADVHQMPSFAIKYKCCPVARFACVHEANNPSGSYIYRIARLSRSLTTTTATTGTRSRLMARSFASPREGARTSSVQWGAWKKSILDKRSVSAGAHRNDFFCTSILSRPIHGHNT